MTETGSTVERLNAELVEVEKRAACFQVGRISGADLRALLAVVEAAQWVDEKFDGANAAHVSAIDKVRALSRLRDKLAALHSQASDEGKA